MRPLLGHAVDAGHGQFPARVLPGHAPGRELMQARGHERGRRVPGVWPAGIAGRGVRPVEQPVDVPDVPRGLPGPLVGEVPEQVRGRRDPVLLLGDQGDPLG